MYEERRTIDFLPLNEYEELCSRVKEVLWWDSSFVVADVRLTQQPENSSHLHLCKADPIYCSLERMCMKNEGLLVSFCFLCLKKHIKKTQCKFYFVGKHKSGGPEDTRRWWRRVLHWEVGSVSEERRTIDFLLLSHEYDRRVVSRKVQTSDFTMHVNFAVLI